jgi:hypothetical protein
MQSTAACNAVRHPIHLQWANMKGLCTIQRTMTAALVEIRASDKINYITLMMLATDGTPASLKAKSM